MNRKAIRFEYDRDVDAAYVKLNAGKVRESEEVQPGVIVDFDGKGRIVGVEVLRFTRRFLTQPKIKPISASRGRSLKKSA